MPEYLSPGVYVEEVDSGPRPIEGVATAVAAFVGFAEKGTPNAPTLVSSWEQFTTTFGGYCRDAYLPHAVAGWFKHGGGSCFVVRIGAERNGDGAARKELTGPAAALPSADGGKPSFDVRAKSPDATGISVEVADSEEGDSAETFRLVVKQDGKEVETHTNLSSRRGRQFAPTVVNDRSALIELLESATGTLARPVNGEVALMPSATEPGTALEPVASADYVGDVAARTGFAGLEAVDEVTILCAPDLMKAYELQWLTRDDVRSVQQAMLDHCALMGDRVAILDPLPGQSPAEVLQWATAEANYDSKYGAFYYPWIKVDDPATKNQMLIPPSGHIAGVWALVDKERGVHKAPANEILRGVVDLELKVTMAEQALLNPKGINCIRSFPGRGIRVWGARTVSSDPAWRYLNVRRLFNYLEESILSGTQWAVFEPNDLALWARLRRTIADFLVNEWRKGALFGVNPSEAFFVVCDETNNIAATIDLGQVVCEIAVAPVKPAEFVIFRLAQFSGGALVAE